MSEIDTAEWRRLAQHHRQNPLMIGSDTVLSFCDKIDSLRRELEPWREKGILKTTADAAVRTARVMVLEEAGRIVIARRNLASNVGECIVCNDILEGISILADNDKKE